MHVVSDVADVRSTRWAEADLSWGLVPTMGFLHEGHLDLVRRARQENARVGVSIFVNPTQFGDAEDLLHYPRNLESDLDLLRAADVDLVWTPTAQTVYPGGFQSYVSVEEMSRTLEGASRPGHFRGVTTVVSILFNVFQPTRAYFGQKDAQQVAVLRRMVGDLRFNLDLVVCPTRREPDGLAMSSRNVRLSPAARVQASCLYRGLQAARVALDRGERSADRLRAIITDIVEAEPLARVDYVSAASATTLTELDRAQLPLLLSLAVHLDGVRLIDNLQIEEW